MLPPTNTHTITDYC